MTNDLCIRNIQRALIVTPWTNRNTSKHNESLDKPARGPNYANTIMEGSSKKSREMQMQIKASAACLRGVNSFKNSGNLESFFSKHTVCFWYKCFLKSSCALSDTVWQKLFNSSNISMICKSSNQADFFQLRRKCLLQKTLHSNPNYILVPTSRMASSRPDA